LLWIQTDARQATGETALYIIPGFTRRIIGLKDEESDAILQLLFKVNPRNWFKMANADESFQHISVSADLQVRVKWDDRTVSIWDNRVTSHTATSDYNVHNPEEGLRHGVRLTTLAEQPVGVRG
jgi:sulfonate dioxygenase